MTPEASLPLEHFIQAVQRQLDNAQTAMAVKARSFNLPLTFAIKDITMDLRAHVEFARSEIRIRPAGPSDKDASVFHLVFTAITRPMIEENAIAFESDPQDEIRDELTDDERKKLEWSGVRTRSQLRELAERGGERQLERITGLPVDRLRKALEHSATPMIHDVSPAEPPSGEPADLPARLRLRGRNLMRNGPPHVTIGGEPVSVLSADAQELVIAPQAHQLAGELRVSTSPDLSGSTTFDLRPLWTAARAAAPPEERR